MVQPRDYELALFLRPGIYFRMARELKPTTDGQVSHSTDSVYVGRLQLMRKHASFTDPLVFE
jgi:hypothetical protein